jgi:hypothetical protein
MCERLRAIESGILRCRALKNPWNDAIIHFIIGFLCLRGAEGPFDRLRTVPESIRRAPAQNGMLKSRCHSERR